jgi:hypothetical protein
LIKSTWSLWRSATARSWLGDCNATWKRANACPAVQANLPDALAALTPIVDVLEQLGVRYHVGGSLASSAYGRPRATADVDLVAELRMEQIGAFVEQLQPTYYVERASAREAVQTRRSFNLIHLETMVKIDVFVPENRPFDQQEMSGAGRQALDLAADARTFFVKSPEDLVLRKLAWFRAGGEVSERQWSDVVGVLKVQAGRLDREHLARWSAELGIADLLERAFAEAKTDS